MVLQDGFSDLYSDNRMSKMPISRPHCSRFDSGPYTKPSDLMICSGDCGYPTSCHGCCTRSSLPDWDTYRQSSPPYGGYPQILEEDYVRDPSEISSMDTPEYMYEENAPRNYEGFESSNIGVKNVDAEEVKPDMALFQNRYMEDRLCEVAAIVIQSAYRGYMARKLDILNKMRKIANVRERVTKVGDDIQSAYREYMVRKSDMGETADVCKRVTNVGDCISYLYASFDPEVRKELEEKVVVLLLQLDSLEVLPPNIGEIRKSVARELTGFLEEHDCLPPAGDKEVSTAHMDQKNDEAVESGFSKTLPSCRFFTKSEEMPVVASMVSVDLMTLETQSRILTKENELRKLVKEHASLVSHLTRRVDVLEEKLAAEQNQVRGKLARNRYQYARDQDYNQNEEEEEIYDETDEQQYYQDERITYSTENSELLFLVLCCLLVWGTVWFM